LLGSAFYPLPKWRYGGIRSQLAPYNLFGLTDARSLDDGAHRRTQMASEALLRLYASTADRFFRPTVDDSSQSTTQLIVIIIGYASLAGGGA
jgi:hypothetical protein